MIAAFTPQVNGLFDHPLVAHPIAPTVPVIPVAGICGLLYNVITFPQLPGHAIKRVNLLHILSAYYADTVLAGVVSS